MYSKVLTSLVLAASLTPAVQSQPSNQVSSATQTFCSKINGTMRNGNCSYTSSTGYKIMLVPGLTTVQCIALNESTSEARELSTSCSDLIRNLVITGVASKNPSK